MKSKLFTLIALLSLISGSLWAQHQYASEAPETTEAAPAKEGDTVVTFTFAPGNDLFVLQGNETQLANLLSLVDRYRAEIVARRMPLRVDGYCASLPTPAENLRTAYLRANRVKSELITQKALTEDDFITGNYATAYGDRKDLVVVTLRIPSKDETKPAEPAKQPTDAEPVKKDNEPKKDAAGEAPEAVTGTPKASGTPVAVSEIPKASEASETPKAPAKPYTLALRTNLLYDAFLLPTLGIEWRITDRVGIKLDGSLSRWGSATGNVQKIWLLNPEVRWYLLDNRRLYLGLSGNYAEYNVYGYPLGNLLRDNTGYQGNLWNAGLTIGYQLRLARALSLDFNLGLGYTRAQYDSFTMIDHTRVIRVPDRTKTLWGSTQAGISLVWTIGGKKQ